LAALGAPPWRATKDSHGGRRQASRLALREPPANAFQILPQPCSAATKTALTGALARPKVG
jgi:hypothetical protein